jgi:phosphate/sulfate permease
MIKSFDDVLSRVKSNGIKKVAVAVAQDEPVLEAVRDAKKMGIAEAVLVGDRAKIEEAAKAVGMDMVKLEKHQGFSADMAAVLCLFAASVFGLPVSTTHTKTTAIMGVGAAKRISSVNWGVVKDMVLAWFLTFPGCGLIGFLMAIIFMKIF